VQNALDTFRAQREAADQVHARLTEVAQLLARLTKQVDAIAANAELRAVLRDEHTWLLQAQRLLADVRHFREQERLRFWPGVWRRWVLAVSFALASAVAAGAGYAWWIAPYATELIELQERAKQADAIAARIAAMTPIERRQFDVLVECQTPGR
jgi:hypothetical protein